ncbi:hypothetical protein A3731_16840 [Roseovarius sp. HI0049]|nr:hypothetical protein A3731_16840 [Roseovarius sp. HI0049]
MVIQADHVADDANVVRLLQDGHGKGGVLEPGVRDSGLQTHQAGLRRHDGRLHGGAQRRQGGPSRGKHSQLHGCDVAPGPRDPFEDQGLADIV